MTTCSTHVLDSVRGAPASGVGVRLLGPDGDIATDATDADGRVRFEADLAPGDHTIAFATGAWFDADGRDHLHPQILVAFTVEPGRPHLHVALLLSPFAYTTYRGS